MVAETTRVLLL